ncbi:MAG: hypothetical protein J6Y03_00760 [Alphaproteobacteria bacterium]|nr:hypothetical protein [Alphaproteobacteria bacterium]
MLRTKQLPLSFRIIQSGCLRLSESTQSRVDELWQAALSHLDSRLFNGRIFSATRIEEDAIIGSFVEYKYLIAQHMDPRLKLELNIRPVSILGLLTCQDGVLFGKRQNWVATRPNEWGLMPSKYIGTDTFSHDGSIDYVKSFLIALKNEVNIDAQFLNKLEPLVLLEEKSMSEDHYSIVMHADIDLSSFAIKRAHLTALQDEYGQIEVFPMKDITPFLTDNVGHDISVASTILGEKGYLALESDCA